MVFLIALNVQSVGVVMGVLLRQDAALHTPQKEAFVERRQGFYTLLPKDF